MIDFYQLTLERIHKVPAGWKWLKIDSHQKPEDFMLVHGAVPVGTYRSGKRKGRPKYPAEKDRQAIWLRRSEVRQVQAEWEAETGKCYVCEGTGQHCYGHNEQGPMWRTCSRCNGAGVPQKEGA